MRHKRFWIPLLALVVVMVFAATGVAWAVTTVEGFSDTLMAILSSQSETNNALLRALEMILP